MPKIPELHSLRGSVVTIEDPYGETARFIVEHAGTTVCIVNYVFRGRRTFPLRIVPGDEVHLGAADPNGWLISTGTVVEATLKGQLTVEFGPLQFEQRRKSYREEVVLVFEIEQQGAKTVRRGRTANVSAGGFAGRLEGAPLPTGARCTARFDMPDGRVVEVRCEKVGGDIEQRFQFFELRMSDEDAFAHIVREAELERRRLRRPPTL